MNNSYISKLLVLTFLVTSCGGGGGGSSNSNTGSGGNNYTPPVINSFTSSEYSIVSGNSVTLSWSSSNASTCAGAGSWGGAKPTNGSETFILSNTGTYEYILT